MPNQLFYGDNLEVLQKYIADASVDLCYVDPPFNSQQNYNQIYADAAQDDYAQTQVFVDTWEWGERAEECFREIAVNPRYNQETAAMINGFATILGKGGMLAYLVNMTARLAEIWRVLKPTGSFYLHCDPTASHYLKILLDAIFGSRGGKFNNEIIWRRHYSHNDGQKFGCIHDAILYYTKSANYTYHRQHLAYDADYIAKNYRGVDKDGRRFRSVSLNAAGQGDAKYFGDRLLAPPQGTHWRWSQERLNTALKDGVIYFTENGVPRQKQFLERMEGVPVQDTWTDFYSLSSHDKERLGYATQKPLALLERIIKASSNAGDTVLDAFCGCGTTVDAAQSLGRKWIGVDITYNSISLIQKRLAERYGEKILGDVIFSGIPQDLAAARALAQKQDDRLRKEFEKWTILTYANNQAKINDKKGADGGIDGVAYTAVGTALFSVKSGAVSVKDVRDLRGVLDRENAAAGILITLNAPTKNMSQEASAAGFLPDPPTMRLPQKTPKIQIVSIQQMLDGARLNLPLPVPVLKAAARAKQKNHQAEIDFDAS
ncbi:restriction endonuclease subunit M [Planctomycetales bacterium]|nr:restriction endonuclease subunit M [Planctomycetales bacterium]GHS96978.1 restriction endonuclease subunit M [Planctomycetales bacterium]GHT03766.1 restriction endonuclease subunit M [Planctomycetales bacterium]